MPTAASLTRTNTALARINVTARRAVDTEPPYDDRSDSPAAAGRALTDGALALSLPAVEHPAPTPEPPALRLVTEPEPAGVDETDFDVVRTGRRGLPAPQRRALVLVRAILEALAGERPVAQLLPWMSEEVFADLEGTVCPGTPRTWAATVRRLIVSEPADGVAEVTAIVQRGVRSAALALRLEGLDGRWVVTALHLG